jgi:hypothetical protein
MKQHEEGMQGIFHFTLPILVLSGVLVLQQLIKAQTRAPAQGDNIPPLKRKCLVM